MHKAKITNIHKNGGQLYQADNNKSSINSQLNSFIITDSDSLAQFNNALASFASGEGGGQQLLDPQPQPVPSNSMRMPGFFTPLPRISYETTFEILILKPRPPPPPTPPPPSIKRVLVHTESLEQKTKNFLDGIYDDDFDTSLRTAKKKIRNIKSMVLKSCDTTKYAEDTVQKAKARDFVHIFTPPIPMKKPTYEVVEVPVEQCDVDETVSILGFNNKMKTNIQLGELSFNGRENNSPKYSSPSLRNTNFELGRASNDFELKQLAATSTLDNKYNSIAKDQIKILKTGAKLPQHTMGDFSVEKPTVLKMLKSIQVQSK